MKTITIEKIKYSIPTCWEDVTIGHQIRVSEIRDGQDHVKILALVAGYGGIPIDVLKQIPFSKVENVFKHFKWVNDPIPIVSTDKFEHEGVTYHLQPDIFDMKTEDVVILLTERENHKDNPAVTYPLMLAIMYRAEGEEYLEDFDYDAKAEKFKSLPIALGFSVFSFFLQTGNMQKIVSLISTPEEAELLLLGKNRELRSILRASVQDGRGNWFTRLGIGLMIRYSKSLDSLWGTCFSSSPSEDTTPRWKLMFRRLGWKKRKGKQN